MTKLNDDQQARPPLTAAEYRAIQEAGPSFATNPTYSEACVFDIARVAYNNDPANAGKEQVV